MSGRGSEPGGRRALHVRGFDFRGVPVPFGSRIGRIFVSSGIAGVDPESGLVASGEEPQVAQLFANIRLGMQAAGGEVDDIIKLNFHVDGETVRRYINEQWLRMFPDRERWPARHTSSGPLPPGLAVQVEFMAVLPAPEI